MKISLRTWSEMKHERALDGWKWSLDMRLLKSKTRESAMIWANLDSIGVNTVLVREGIFARRCSQ